VLKTEQQILRHFEGVYEKREQYNMSWAFKDAQDQLDTYKDSIVDQEMKSKCSLCKQMSKKYESYKEKSHTEVKKQKMISGIFKNMHGIINFLEVILSVLLVLIISEVSHGDFIPHETKLFSVWVVVVFAFIKVFIEHYLLKPWIEDMGWKLYKNSIETLKDLTEDITEQVVYELEAV
jgi:hypothetical protein